MSHVPIGDLLTRLANAEPSRPAVTCAERTITRARLEARANRLARAYADLGVRQGDFVTVALPNSIEMVEALLAIWKLGAIPQPVSARLPARELEEIVALADPSLVVGVTAALVPERASVPPGFEPDRALSDAPLPSRVSPAWKAPTSGGSTGRPKLIVAGRTSALDLGFYAGLLRLHGAQTQLVPGPLFHNAPLMLATVGCCLGQHVVLMPRFEASAALAAIAHHRVQVVNLVPTMMLRMLRLIEAAPGAHDLSSLEVVWHMAAPCPPWLKQRWIELVGAERLHELYGGTEGQTFCVIRGDEWLARRGSVGRPAFGEVKVIDADGRDLPPGEVGEVLLRRPADWPPTYRYLGATARTFDGGWESLGDMGSLDADGYLYLADRRQDLLIVGGENVYPAEVEAALMEHPQVRSCAVVGLPDEELGERVHALVQAAGACDEAALRAFVAARLVRYKVPRSIRFVDEPLRDDAGKLRRQALREHELARGG
ncbi:MAG: AMP-binding protein [Conexibacter sp.]